MTRNEADLDLLKRASREAGNIALSFFRRNPQVFWKEGNSPVSQADLAVDGFLRDFLLSARPRYGWVSEETASEAAQGDENRFFVVDPIDGTRSFLRGEPTWCVSLAVIADGRPVAGVIDAPVVAEVFAATAEGEATLNGRPFAPAGEREDGRLRVSMPDALVRRLDPADRAGLDFQGAIPSLAYRLALVACGRLDGTIVQPRANDWDIAVADLLLERAGGALVTEDDRQHIYKLHPKRHGLLLAGGAHAIASLAGVASRLGAPSMR